MSNTNENKFAGFGVGGIGLYRQKNGWKNGISFEYLSISKVNSTPFYDIDISRRALFLSYNLTKNILNNQSGKLLIGGFCGLLNDVGTQLPFINFAFPVHNIYNGAIIGGKIEIFPSFLRYLLSHIRL
ncbi:MAG: hypothetical protein IPO92_21620 [Saprospiraceae bacterium]|nr:hypothetical protein [Saprospiraceae bacterium]